MITESQKRYFRNPAHGNITEFYFTANGSAFFRQSDAQLQAANLKKQGKSDVVTCITRAEYDAQMKAEETQHEASAPGNAGPAGAAPATAQ